MKTYTLTWRVNACNHRVVGKGPSILHLYDMLADYVNVDFLLIYAQYGVIITRNMLRQEMGLD